MGRFVLVAALLLSACAKQAGPDLDPQDQADQEGRDRRDRIQKAQAALGRDWAEHPAVVELTKDDGVDEVFAVSDVHGGIDTLVPLLEVGGVIDSQQAWAAGPAVLVIAGDLIDKGLKSIEVIDFVRALEAKATAAAGRVIVTIGNHEAEFLRDPLDDKFTRDKPEEVGIDLELLTAGIDPESIASGADPEGRGRWLLELPFAARVKKWFFSHGGATHGRTVKQLEDVLEDGIKKHGYSDDDVTGDNSILELQKWYDHDDPREMADQLKVDHLVFGHDPGALKDQESDKGKIKMKKGGLLIKIDCMMGLTVKDPQNPDDEGQLSRGFLLHLHTKGRDTAETIGLDADGNKITETLILNQP
jgi:hypothetical protein